MKSGKDENKKTPESEVKEEWWCPCGKPAPRNKKVCPSCGARMKPGA